MLTFWRTPQARTYRIYHISTYIFHRILNNRNKILFEASFSCFQSGYFDKKMFCLNSRFKQIKSLTLQLAKNKGISTLIKPSLLRQL